VRSSTASPPLRRIADLAIPRTLRNFVRSSLWRRSLPKYAPHRSMTPSDNNDSAVQPEKQITTVFRISLNSLRTIRTLETRYVRANLGSRDGATTVLLVPSTIPFDRGKNGRRTEQVLSPRLSSASRPPPVVALGSSRNRERFAENENGTGFPSRGLRYESRDPANILPRPRSPTVGRQYLRPFVRPDSLVASD